MSLRLVIEKWSDLRWSAPGFRAAKPSKQILPPEKIGRRYAQDGAIDDKPDFFAEYCARFA